MTTTMDDAWVAPYSQPQGCDPVGYAWLVRAFHLPVAFHWRWSFTGPTERQLHGRTLIEVRPPSRRPKSERPIDHWLWALKNEGVSMSVNTLLLRRISKTQRDELADQLTQELRSKPFSSYRRRAWFLLENLSPVQLPVEDLSSGNYMPLLNPKLQVTGPIRKIRRYRLDINLLGTINYAPAIRRTPTIDQVDAAHLRERIRNVVGAYNEESLRRAINYLYAKETRASFAIERETPSPDRAERFVVRLKDAPKVKRLWKALLVRLQNTLVDSRYADVGWRHEQNYIGSGRVLGMAPSIHAVFPKPDDIPALMVDFLEAASVLQHGVGDGLDDRAVLDPVLAAAALAFGFVLLHPFSDGNGRIHRWLIHWMLVRAHVTPEDMIIPVSAVMLSHRAEYEAVLEGFSTPLLELIDYTVREDHHMEVHSDTIDYYRYPDVTEMAAKLWGWLSAAIDNGLAKELDFLERFDEARRRLHDVIDIPNRKAHLFIKLVAEHGSISKTKRRRHFPELTNEELAEMQEAVRTAYTGR